MVPNVLLVKDDMDDATACAITTAIWSNADRIEAVHPAGASLTPDTAVQTHPIPLHPGAKMALDELG